MNKGAVNWNYNKRVSSWQTALVRKHFEFQCFKFLKSISAAITYTYMQSACTWTAAASVPTAE